MKSPHADVRGSALWIVLIAVVVIISTSFIIYGATRKTAKDDAVKTAAATATLNRTASVPAAADGAANDGDDAANLVKKAYAAGTEYVNRTTNAGQGEIDTLQPYLDPALYAKLSDAITEHRTDHDQLTCAQMKPDAYTVAFVRKDGNSATVNITETFGSTKQVIVAAVDLPSLKITDIACPQ